MLSRITLHLVLLAVLLFQSVGVSMAQGAGVPAVRFDVTFRIAGQPAPAGSEIVVLTARSATDTFVCARGRVRDGGTAMIEVPPSQRCADQGNAGGPVPFIFTYTGERVGSASLHIDLNRPNTLGRTERISLSAESNPARPQSGPNLVVARFYGTLRLDGQPAPAGTPVRVITARSATDTFDCGNTTTIDGGFFSLDVPAEERCTDQGNAGGAPQFVFLTGSQRVGSTSLHLDLNRPSSLGRDERVSLSGRYEASEAASDCAPGRRCGTVTAGPDDELDPADGDDGILVSSGGGPFQGRVEYETPGAVSFTVPEGPLQIFVPGLQNVANWVNFLSTYHPVETAYVGLAIAGGRLAGMGVPTNSITAVELATEDEVFAAVGTRGAQQGQLYQGPAGTVRQADLAVNRDVPFLKWLDRPIGTSATQNQVLAEDIETLQNMGATEFRVNQQQIALRPGTPVSQELERVGINRPDLQFTYQGRRFHIEYDRPPATRAIAHAQRILANDPNAVVILKTVP